MPAVRNLVNQYLGVYADRRMIIMALIGYSCGIPLFLTSSTLGLWLKQVGFTNTAIGTFSLCALPYTVKFIWSPFIDRLRLPFLTKRFGRRRAWLLLSQVMLIITIVAISFLNPREYLTLTIILATAIAFFSATQDVVMLAYQVERLGRNQYGSGEAMGIFGFRMGMLTSGAGAFYLAGSITWPQVYQIMALLLGIGLITTLCIAEPDVVINQESQAREQKAHGYLLSHPRLSGWQAQALSWLYGAVLCPFYDFVRNNFWLPALLIMFFYKLGDNLIGNMKNIFFVEMGYSLNEIASVSKIFGMLNSILGGLICGVIIARFGITQSLLFNGFVHGISIFLYVLMAQVGYSIEVLYFTIAIEHITSGMRTTALFAYQMTLCNPVYAATQLALLTSFVNLGRTLTAACSGWLSDHLGWVNFFNLAGASTIVSLGLVWWLAKLEKTAFSWKQTKQLTPTNP
jgi:PAT family beta-lactamase induction signal transducer AmpG